MSKVTIDRVERRKRRVSPNIRGTASRPRISISRSNKYIYAQAIDDMKRVTVAAFSSHSLAKSKEGKGNKSEQAKEVGKRLAKILKEKSINEAVFDRGQYEYQGRVKVLAEGLREGELKI